MRRRAGGFTLIELMVSLAVGGIALGSMYAIGSATTRNLRTQERVASVQGALRTAMERLKKDFQRAGFLGTPNISLGGEACGTPVPPPGTASAIFNYQKGVAAAKALADPDNQNLGATFDDVTLMGNYATSGEYSGISFPMDKNHIQLNEGSQSFVRDFDDWTTRTLNGAAINDAFAVGRMVRVHSLSETFHVARITGVNNSTPVTVAIDPPVPDQGCPASGGWVSPLNVIRYTVQAPLDDEAPLGTGTPAGPTTGPMAVLRRTEVQGNNINAPLMDATNTAPLDDRALLDYVVRFNIDFRMGVQRSLNWAVAAPGAVNATPEEVRSVIIDLAVRTPEEDPAMMFDPAADTLRSFKVFAETKGAARVRSAHAEIFLPNIAFKAY